MNLIGKMQTPIKLWFTSCLLFAISFAGCGPYEPSVSIKVKKGTNQTLQIFSFEDRVGEVMPSGNVQIEVSYRIDKYSLTAKDSGGKVVYTSNFTNAVFPNGNPMA